MLIPPVFKKAAMLAAVSIVPLSHAAFANESPEIKRSVLLQQKLTLPSPNVHAKVIRVNFPQGVKTPRHTHEGPGPRYVVKGTLQVVEGDKTGIYSAGEVFWESGQAMTVENIGGESAELIIFEMGPGH